MAPKQKGFFTDPHSDFGRINAEMWRAVRLVVDTGIHAKADGSNRLSSTFAANTSKPDADPVGSTTLLRLARTGHLLQDRHDGTAAAARAGIV